MLQPPLALQRQGVVADLHSIEPSVVIVAKDRSRSGDSRPVAQRADLEDTGSCQLTCAPKRVLTIGSKPWCGGGAADFGIANTFGELLQKPRAASVA